ncbi:hypothetical protein [Chamaesiphon sp. OTE_20_metabat_361]|uniref:hypothetical protein n=1 Tax=Chamaesiphon sp. OTE_20_metabat_361 TaxID=2964689 RepID=UPI00286D38FE|nr:hypothetical protein [Chamaesiphon sp. OTE_20_metabat_361]
MQVNQTILTLKLFHCQTKFSGVCTRHAIANAICLVAALWLNCPVFAQSNSIPSGSEVCDVNLTLLKPTEVGADPNIITADTVSPEGNTIPSLWWTNEQLPSKLVVNWIANRRQSQIYLLVNSQYWNILDYVDRYRTLSRFGRVAQSYGYDLKICNDRKISLARYTCDVKSGSTDRQAGSIIPPQNCQIWLNSGDRDGMGVQGK